MTASKALSAVAALALIAGCTAPTGERDHTRTGLLTGALAGAALGNLIGDDTTGTLIGAGVGAMAGGVIGADLDRQAAELRGELGPEVQIENTGTEIVVTMPQDILFATDSAELRGDLQSDLRAIAANLQRYPDSTVFVTGHTDSTGSDAHNQRLSERRADAVASVLITSGVSSRRIVARGAGETQPVASNETSVGRAQNRRVEITIRPSA